MSLSEAALCRVLEGEPGRLEWKLRVRCGHEKAMSTEFGWLFYFTKVKSSPMATSATRSQTSGGNADVLTIKEALQELLEIEGAVGAAIVDYESGMTLGTDGGRNLDMELAGAGSAEVVRSKKNIIHDLDIDETIEDLLISLETQYHLIRMCQHHENVFMYTVINRSQGNLGLARRKIDRIDERLELQ